MDNDELDNIFSSADEEDKNKTDEAVSETADVNESSSEEEVEVIEEVIEVEEESSDDEEKKASDEKREQKRRQKIEKRKETIKDIEEFEAYIDKKREDARRKKEARKAEQVPLSSRVFLEDFPLSFKQLVIILLSIIILIVALIFAFSPALRMSKYVVEGNHQVSEEAIMELVGIQNGDHLIRSYYGIESRIKRTTPYIKDIKISFEYPSTLKVTVVERQKVAYIRTADGYAAIDKDGIVLEFSSDFSAEVHPVLCGVEVNSVVLGQDIGITDNLSYQKMIVILGAVLSAEENSLYHSDYSFFDNLQEVRILPSGMIFITVMLPNGSLLTVKLNDVTTIDDKMHWLLFAIEENGMDGLPAGSLDMTEDSPIYHSYDNYYGYTEPTDEDDEDA